MCILCTFLCTHSPPLTPTTTTEAREPGQGLSRGSHSQICNAGVLPQCPCKRQVGGDKTGGRMPSKDTAVPGSFNRGRREERLSVPPPRSQQALRTFAGSLRSRQDDGGRETACPGRAKTCSVDHTGALDIITIPRKSANLATFLCTVVGFYLLLSFPWTTSSLRAGPLLCGPNIWNRDSHP